MAATTVTTLQTRAIAEVGGRTDIGAVDQLAYYNNGQQLICRVANLRAMRVSDATTMDTVDGAYEITLPSDVKSIIGIRVVDGVESWVLHRLTCERFDELFPLPTATSYEAHPTHYSRRSATKIFIWPTADAAYNLTIEFYKFMGNHAANSEAIDFPTMEDALVEAMKYYVWNRLGEHEKAVESMTVLRGLVESALASENESLDMKFDAGTYGGMAVPTVPEPHLDPFRQDTYYRR